MRDGMIDSTFDFTPKGLGELKAWLEPWFWPTGLTSGGTRSGAIPGEVKMWAGGTLPDSAVYGTWVWADGAAYLTATYPTASANIANEWRTFAGAADPGADSFRVPDLRGMAMFGMDAMPGGARANRITRAASATLAGRTGEEYHTITIGEVPSHSHQISGTATGVGGIGGGVLFATSPAEADFWPTDPIGGGGAHENLPPAVFIPYMVKLDDIG